MPTNQQLALHGHLQGERRIFCTVCNTEKVTVADTVVNREVNHKCYFFESPASTNFTTRARGRVKYNETEWFGDWWGVCEKFVSGLWGLGVGFRLAGIYSGFDC
jgi:hypothetical protein